ncbi:putative tumor protein d52 [Schistosoma mansoni]|uniref:putative tumor protein d52 n=1 Tax=Schistosoma mansoni TaxID=6183 RepID=UPI0001A620AD|nr:putative tumor protein d52 [Schistosoma mansoni]|eukprot:XP_018649328.1 putative tumor protein d52 [Schistosoma mansoni]
MMDPSAPVVPQEISTDQPVLSDEEYARLQVELSQVEEEIRLLQETLVVKQRRLNEIKKALGFTTLSTLQYDLMEGIHKLEDTEAYIKTSELLSKAKDKTVNVAQDAKEKVESTISAIRNSEVVKSLNDKVGSAYSTVKILCMDKFTHLPAITWIPSKNGIRDVIIHSTYGHPPDDGTEYVGNNNTKK